MISKLQLGCFTCLFLLVLACTELQSGEHEGRDPMTSKTLTREALSLSWELLEKGQAMADAGKSISKILNLLPDSTLVQTNETSILFFVEGSIPMIIELPRDRSAPITKGGGQSQNASVGHLVSSVSGSFPFSIEADAEVNVVAFEKGEDARGDKKALVLMPFSWEFQDYDDGITAIKFLIENTNYEDRVDVFSENLSLEVYTSFAEYDLVHLSTHGSRYCNPELFANGNEIEVSYGGDSEYCRTLINTGINPGFENDEDVYAFVMDPQNLDYVGNVIPAKNNFYLKSTFFSDFYSNGPENKIWIFSGCELGQRSDLTESIQSILQDGHFFYWSNTVYTEDAMPAFEEFYKNLVLEGLDAKKAYEEIPINLRESLDSYVEINNTAPGNPNTEEILFDPGSTPLQDSLNQTTSLLHLYTGKPRHGIEIIEMYHPEEEDQRIRSGDFYPLVGDFGDGEDEALTLKVKLKGYSREEFQNEQMTLSLKVDDEIVLDRRLFLPDVEDDEIEVDDLEEREYGVEVTIADIPIPDVGDKEHITLKAYLHFDPERFSIHKEEVVIKADGIKTIVQASGKTIVMTYDDKRRSMKMETPGAQGPMYLDGAGYLYRFTSQQGWVKVNLSGMMGMINTMPLGGDIGDIPVGSMLQPSKKNFFFPMVEWGIRFRMTAFERNTNFKKQEEDCDKPAPCYRFTGITGQEQGVSVLFDPNGRLKELRYQGKRIKYEYGMYDVIIPQATEMNIGI